MGKMIVKQLVGAALLGSVITLSAGCANVVGDPSTEAKPDKKAVNNKPDKRNTAAEKTNVLYIVLDDMGFSDLGSYGSEIKTPNMDRLAENGLRYNNFHVSPVCSPTRAALLTGRNPHTVGMGHVANFEFGEKYPNRRGEIVPEAGTIAEVLSEHDYHNYALGKWHLLPTAEASPAGPYHNWPLGKGFHRYFGNLEDSSDQYRPELVEDNTQILPPEDKEFHYSEALAEKGIQYIYDHISTRPERPFFMYLAFGAQHMPHQVPEKYIDMYDGVYDVGWEEIRKQRFERQKELGIIPEDAELAPLNPDVPEWDELTEEEKEVAARFMETYAGFLTHTDEQIGKIIQVLEETGELDHTLIFLISDNGASAAGGPFGATNQSLAYNAIPEDFEHVKAKKDEIGSETTTPDYPAGWGQVSNTPFKMYKNTTYAGGIRTPLIVHWPDGIKAKGEIRSQFVYVSDITATVYDILGIQVPKRLNGVKQLPLSGDSFAHTFDDADAEAAKKTQYFEASGHRAIYHDGWKAIAHHKKGEPFREDEWELYHLEKDFSEVRNLTEKEPKKLKQLKKIWDREAKKHNVLPLSDLFLEAFTNLPEESLRAKKKFVYYPQMSHLSDSAGPFTINRTYTITIPFEYEPGDEGVLLAVGNDQSGYTFFIKDGRLVYEHHNGMERYKIVSAQPLKEGKNILSFRFQKTGENKGTGMLYLNDAKAGETGIETLPYKVSFEGMDIGKDLLYPVSPEYADLGTFPYSGKIEKVVYEFEEAARKTIK